MESDAYQLGHLDAALQYGLTKEAYARVILPGLGALAGYALAPEGEKGRGAILGGLGGLGVQSAFGGLGGAHVPVAAPAAAAAPASKPALDLETLKRYGLAAMEQGKEDIGKWLKAPYVPPKTASVEVGGSIPIPGFGGIGLGLKDQRERLPGMSKWVPRALMERSFDYVDAGLSPEEAGAREADRGSFTHPLLGGALGAGATLRFAPGSGAGGALLGGLAGGTLGELYHRLTRDTRRQEGEEGYEGAAREREKFPISKHKNQTANEASPLTISRGIDA